MLPRIRAVTAAPKYGGGASPWPGTAGASPWPAAVSPIPIRACRWRRSARWPGWTSCRPPTSRPLWRPARRRRAGAPSRWRARPRQRRPLVAARAIVGALHDDDPLVVVGAAWFLAERHTLAAVPELVATATGHDDAAVARPRWRRSAPSATPTACPPCSSALTDVPTVRRRATVALAGFDDPRVAPALRAATRTATGRCARRPASCSTIPQTDRPAPAPSGPSTAPPQRGARC